MGTTRPDPASRPSAIALQLDSDDLEIAFDLLSSNTALQPGVEVAAPGETRIRFRNRLKKGLVAEGRMDFELFYASPDSVDPLASWLYRCLQGRLPKVRIGRRSVEVEPAALRSALSAAIGAG